MLKAGIETEILLFQSSFSPRVQTQCNKKTCIRAGSVDADQFTSKLTRDDYLHKIVLWRSSIEALLLGHPQVILEPLIQEELL